MQITDPATHRLPATKYPSLVHEVRAGALIVSCPDTGISLTLTEGSPTNRGAFQSVNVLTGLAVVTDALIGTFEVPATELYPTEA